MKSNTAILDSNPDQSSTRSFINSVARKVFHKKFSGITNGFISVIENGQLTHFGNPAHKDDAELHAEIVVKHDDFYSDVIYGGTVGAGEAYMSDLWSCERLTTLVRIILLNEHVLDDIDGGVGKLLMPARKLFHFLHRNTRSGSRGNISAHYDLGNPLFSLFLDPTMMYSSAVFESDDMTLEQASVAKLDRICRKLQLKDSDHLLEIGTGWGGFAIHAASNYGCHVTTTTISREQYDYAREQIDRLGLSDRITLLRNDYRDLVENYQGAFDKIVSIEMIEAVGHEYYKTYFNHCSRLLKPDGMMLLQSITIADQRYDRALKEVDFIQRYIFPGGCLPSIDIISTMVKKYTDMRFYHLEDIGADYARTLKLWRQRFFEQLDKVRHLGYSDEFIRMWDFYLCYCEGGFMERSIGTVQLLLTKPGNRRAPVLAV